MPNYSPPPAIIPQNESQGERMELWPSAGNIHFTVAASAPAEAH